MTPEDRHLGLLALIGGELPAEWVALLFGLPLDRMAWVLPPAAVWNVLRRLDFARPELRRARDVAARANLMRNASEGHGCAAEADTRGVGCTCVRDLPTDTELVVLTDPAAFLRGVYTAALVMNPPPRLDDVPDVFRVIDVASALGSVVRGLDALEGV